MQFFKDTRDVKNAPTNSTFNNPQARSGPVRPAGACLPPAEPARRARLLGALSLSRSLRDRTWQKETPLFLAEREALLPRAPQVSRGDSPRACPAFVFAPPQWTLGPGDSVPGSRRARARPTQCAGRRTRGPRAPPAGVGAARSDPHPGGDARQRTHLSHEARPRELPRPQRGGGACAALISVALPLLSPHC